MRPGCRNDKPPPQKVAALFCGLTLPMGVLQDVRASPEKALARPGRTVIHCARGPLGYATGRISLGRNGLT
jgi:hypothetical protein